MKFILYYLLLIVIIIGFIFTGCATTISENKYIVQFQDDFNPIEIVLKNNQLIRITENWEYKGEFSKLLINFEFLNNIVDKVIIDSVNDNSIEVLSNFKTTPTGLQYEKSIIINGQTTKVIENRKNVNKDYYILQYNNFNSYNIRTAIVYFNHSIGLFFLTLEGDEISQIFLNNKSVIDNVYLDSKIPKDIMKIQKKN